MTCSWCLAALEMAATSIYSVVKNDNFLSFVQDFETLPHELYGEIEVGPIDEEATSMSFASHEMTPHGTIYSSIIDGPFCVWYGRPR